MAACYVPSPSHTWQENRLRIPRRHLLLPCRHQQGCRESIRPPRRLDLVERVGFAK